MYHSINHIYLPYIVRKLFSVNQLLVLHCSTFTVKITIIFYSASFLRGEACVQGTSNNKSQIFLILPGIAFAWRKFLPQNSMRLVQFFSAVSQQKRKLKTLPPETATTTTTTDTHIDKRLCGGVIRQPQLQFKRQFYRS